MAQQPSTSGPLAPWRAPRVSAFSPPQSTPVQTSVNTYSLRVRVNYWGELGTPHCSVSLHSDSKFISPGCHFFQLYLWLYDQGSTQCWEEPGCTHTEVTHTSQTACGWISNRQNMRKGTDVYLPLAPTFYSWSWRHGCWRGGKRPQLSYPPVS